MMRLSLDRQAVTLLLVASLIPLLRQILLLQSSGALHPREGVVHDAPTTSTNTNRQLPAVAVNDGWKWAKRSTSSNVDDFVEPTEPLNIVLLYPDDWRYDSIDNPAVHTPFLSKLAATTGIQMALNFVTTSICWISRATMFTGEYASRHETILLRSPVPFYARWNNTWVGRLRHAGYYTGLAGKWQFADDNQDFVRSSFDWSMLSGGHWGRWQGQKMHMADVHALEAMSFLRNRPPTQPFALTVAFYPPKAVGTSTDPGAQWMPDPHVRHGYYNRANMTIPRPHDEFGFDNLHPHIRKDRTVTRARWRERFEGEERYQESVRNYYALVTQIDDACRRVVQELEDQGVLNRTLVIITSDNGMFLGDHGLAGKWYPYEESIRVPFIILDPRAPPEQRGRTNHDSFTLNIDLAATIMAAAQVEPYASLQGRDISQLYRRSQRAQLAQQPWRRDFFYEFPARESMGITQSTALVTHEYKYMEWPWDNFAQQLFDRRQDEYEQHDLLRQGANVSQATQKLVARLKLRHDELKAAVI